ncbi:MAG: hypothetical protein RMJ87_13955 [Cytophagales bacterium]|nr:hypothetical protein [Bernardetiaceae bacterium]MDW8206127.1 hypothetical protein [Cytophagales bacterium]
MSIFPPNLFPVGKHIGNVLQKPWRSFVFARNLLKQGGHVVETSFEYQNHTFVLRTIIGFGDIINFIPDPEWGHADVQISWQKHYQEYVALHFEKVKNFLNAFQLQAVFWENSLRVVIGAANIYPAYQVVFLGEWLLAIMPLLSAVYLYFFGKATAQQLVKLLWQIAHSLFVVSRKGRKRTG